MKRYELLKDLPFAKAGGTFSLHRGGIKDCITLFKGDEEVYTIYSEVSDFITLRDALQEKGYTFSACELEYVPNNNSQISNP